MGLIKHIFVYLWGLLLAGGMTGKCKPVLPIYLRLDISSNLSRALSCLRLSGQNFLVQRVRHNRKRRPYELRTFDKCTRRSNQDEEEHMHIAGLSACLVSLRTQHRQLVFPPQYDDSPSRLRTSCIIRGYHRNRGCACLTHVLCR